MFKRDWTRSSKYDEHSEHNDEHTWNDQLQSTRIFTLIMNKTFIRAIETMRKVSTSSIWIC